MNSLDRFGAWLLVLALGCAPAAPNKPTAAPQEPVVTSPVALAWVEDDAESALSTAQRQHRLVLADLWAPWCHTCLSMKAEVLRAGQVPELSHVALLSIDTERAQNEKFLAEYPVGVWPTFYLIDPKTREVRGRWLGAATPAQLSLFLTGGTARGGAEELARQGDALAAKKAFADAEARYRAALATAPPSWPRQEATLVSLIATLSKQKRDAACLELALSELPRFAPSVGAVDFASSALSCADRASDQPSAEPLRKLAESTLSRDCATAAPGVAVDDHADACANLRRVREALGDRPGAERAAEQALAIIERGSAGAPPERQAIYDWERTSSLIFLGRRAEAEARLREREQQLPDSYNPPHYLARLYRDSQRWDDGLAAIERALGKAYGPRRIGFLGIKAELLKGKGQIDEALPLLQQQLRDYRALPAAQRQPEAEATVQKRIDTWTAETRGTP